MLVEAHGDGVHLSLALGLLHLPPLLGQSALHHGGLGQRAVRVLEQTGMKMRYSFEEFKIQTDQGPATFSILYAN